MGRGADEKSEFEFQHPLEARSMPYAVEAAEARNRAVCCQFKCKEAGRKQLAHRVLPDGRRGICNWCYRGEPHPEDVKAKGREIRVVQAGPAAGVQTSADVHSPGFLKAEARRLGLVIGDEKTLKPGELREAASHFSTTDEGTKEEVMAKQKVCGECGKKLQERNESGFCGKHFYKSKLKGSGGGRRKASHPAVAGNVESPRKANGGAEAVQVPSAAIDKWFAELPAEQKAAVFAREVGV